MRGRGLFSDGGGGGGEWGAGWEAVSPIVVNKRSKIFEDLNYTRSL